MPTCRGTCFQGAAVIKVFDQDKNDVTKCLDFVIHNEPQHDGFKEASLTYFHLRCTLGGVHAKRLCALLGGYCPHNHLQHGAL